MIVVTIISILVSVVMPSYRNYVLESKREDTMTKLLQVIQFQERFYLNNVSYTNNLGGNFLNNTGLGFTVTNANGIVQWEINYSGVATYGIRLVGCADATIYPDNPNITQCVMAVAVPITGDPVEDAYMGMLATDTRGRKILDFNKTVIMDWDNNILPNTMCPDCIANRDDY
jgi:type IV pilus assembly protein PilE